AHRVALAAGKIHPHLDQLALAGAFAGIGFVDQILDLPAHAENVLPRELRPTTTSSGPLSASTRLRRRLPEINSSSAPSSSGMPRSRVERRLSARSSSYSVSLASAAMRRNIF